MAPANRMRNAHLSNIDVILYIKYEAEYISSSSHLAEIELFIVHSNFQRCEQLGLWNILFVYRQFLYESITWTSYYICITVGCKYVLQLPNLHQKYDELLVWRPVELEHRGDLGEPSTFSASLTVVWQRHGWLSFRQTSQVVNTINNWHFSPSLSHQQWTLPTLDWTTHWAVTGLCLQTP